MRFLYVVGGQERLDRQNSSSQRIYERAVVLSVDVHQSRIERVVEYRSSGEVLAGDDSNCLFKAGTLFGDELFLCTETEILSYGVRNWEERMRITLPFFNDVHHVRPLPNGRIMAAVTGLDLVVELERDGRVVHEWSVLDEPLWSRFSRNIDYRKVRSTQPHRSHPNFVFEIDGEPWVTRFLQRDAVSLSALDRRIAIGVEGPHDGCVFDGSVYFTTVDGHIVVADVISRSVIRVVDLQEFYNSENLLGWCRGLTVVDRDTLLVGFSRFRPTRRPEYLAWTQHRIKQFIGSSSSTAQSLATRIACVDLADQRIVWEIDLEEHGMNAVFSIHCAG